MNEVHIIYTDPLAAGETATGDEWAELDQRLGDATNATVALVANIPGGSAAEAEVPDELAIEQPTLAEHLEAVASDVIERWVGDLPLSPAA